MIKLLHNTVCCPVTKITEDKTLNEQKHASPTVKYKKYKIFEKLYEYWSIATAPFLFMIVIITETKKYLQFLHSFPTMVCGLHQMDNSKTITTTHNVCLCNRKNSIHILTASMGFQGTESRQ
jgi:hypothetical protein